MASPFFIQPAQFGQGLQTLAGSVQEFGQQRQQEQRSQEAQKALATAVKSGDPVAIRDVVVQYPEVGERAKQAFGFTNEQTEKIARETYRQALSEPDPARRAQIMQSGIDQISQFGVQPRMMIADRQTLQQNPEAFDRSAKAGFAALASDQEFEAMFGGGEASLPAGAREFAEKARAAGLEPGTERYRQAALVDLGLEPRAGISANERIAQNPELARRVAELEQMTAAASEEGKLGAQLEIKPKIQKAVKAAELEAKEQGEIFTEFDRAQAAMPGLVEVVNKLVTLSDVATYTMGGKAFDFLVKELGFGATEGATARAKMTSLVDNQILPLLRETFGAQFTREEGDRLRATMLDIDAAPSQKKATLESFIDQKMRDLEMKSRRVEAVSGQPSQAGSRGAVDEQEETITLPNGVTVRRVR